MNRCPPEKSAHIISHFFFALSSRLRGFAIAPHFLLIVVACLALFVPSSFSAPPPPDMTGWLTEPAISYADVDLPNSRVVQSSVSTPATEEQLLDLLNSASTGNHGWLLPRPKLPQDTSPQHYVLAFRKPVAVGALDFSGIAATVKFLKRGAPVASDPTSAANWQAADVPKHQSAGALVTLPPGTVTQALLFTDPQPQWPGRLQGLRIMKSRLHNLTPAGFAFTDSEYIGIHSGASPSYHLASHITSGEWPYWQNTGTDNKGLMHRPPVSDYSPSWVILTWRQAQTIGALWMADNFTDFDVEYYVGPDSLNPRAGTENDWKSFRQLRKVPGYGRMIEFPQPVMTRGIRINILATADGPIAMLKGLHVLTDLKNQPVPASTHAGDETAPPPVSIPWSFDFDGKATMVVNGPDGHRVRNLFAREDMSKGQHVTGWDLKDELGNVVPPGTYEWKALAAPPLGLKYEMTCYPNVHDNSPMNAPWLTGQSGPGGWMADHSSHRAAAASCDYVFFGAPVSESGVSFICCDLTGRKLWAIPSFAAWAGSYIMAADRKNVFTMCFNLPLPDESKVDTPTDRLWAVDIATHEFREVAQFRQTSKRKRGGQWLATANNKVYLSVNAPTDWLATSGTPSDVDYENCYPRYSMKRKERFANEDVPDPRSDFLALFRLTQLPPRSKFLEYIESMPGKSPRHHVMMTFKKPVAVGTVVMPKAMDPAVHIRLSVLKPDAPYPPNAGDPKQWEPFQTQPSANWDAAIAPKNCMTRALRVSFIRGDEDPLNEIDDSAEYSKKPLGGEKIEFKNPLGAGDSGLNESTWTGQVEGLKIIGRRFENVAPQAKALISSGAINSLGEWNAQRTRPLSDADPGVYALQWATPQTLRGLAIKEIDGARTEIDVYTGPAGAAMDIAAKENWTHIHTFIQERRTHWIRKTSDKCRYVDGYVDFGKDITTRAIRFRVCEQWSEFGGEEALRWDLKDKLDPTRCRIFGIAALKYIGGETADLQDPLTYQRIEVIDGTTGKTVQELPLPAAGPIASYVRETHSEGMGRSGEPSQTSAKQTSPSRLDGPTQYRPPTTGHGESDVPRPTTDAPAEIFAVSGHDLVKVNLTGGPHQTIISNDLITPQALAIDKAGNFYIYDGAPDRKTIRVYNPAGKMIRNIGKPGGYRAGAWDPMRLNEIYGLAIDKNEQLWAVDGTWPWPRRIGLFSIDGTWKKDFLGNTPYGGGGVLDPYDKRRLFFGPMEFELNWETGHTRLKNLTWLGQTPPGEVPIMIDGRLYLTTRNTLDKVCDKIAIVYRYEKDHSILAAAMGKADNFTPLTQNGIQAALGVKSLRETDFLWCDLNGDGQVQANEVTLLPRTGNMYAGDTFTNFNRDLGIQCGKRRYEVKQFLPSGVPVYEVKYFPKLKGLTLYRMDDGNFHTMGRHSNETLMTPEGKPIWTYPAEGWTVEGTVEAKPYTPEQVVSQYYMAGHDTTHAGDLGEFFAFHTNMGSWNLWTADGMLAGTIFNDQRLDGLRQWHMNEHERGMRLDDITIGQEHFQANICRTSDNHYYAVAGHNHVSVVEILGMDKFKRKSGRIVVTSQDIVKTAAWNAKQARQQASDHVAVLDCYRTTAPPVIDGSTRDWEAESAGARLGEFMGERIHGATLRTAWDDRYLYLCYEVIGIGPMKNSGEQWDRLFKTGAAVDLQIGIDPAASSSRTTPVAGDKRLLMTFTGAKQRPTAVLYEAVVPGTPTDAVWKAVSPVGHVEFDRVQKVDDVKLALEGSDNHYVVEAAIPLADLDLKPAENLRLKLDWGVLVTDTDGNAVTRRTYWSNEATGIVADVPSEARLHPDLWGYVLFHERGRRGVASQPGELNLRPGTGGKTGDSATDQILKDFERDLKDEAKGKK
jgi:hypothetical protein